MAAVFRSGCGALFIAIAAALPPAPAAAQREIAVDGPFVHRDADAVFPLRVGDFQRASVHQYDAGGRDVSANYNLLTPEGRLLITVYIYPAPKISSAGRGNGKAIARASICAQHFIGVNQEISSRRGDARPPVEGGALAVAGVDATLSHRSIYHYRTLFDDQEQDVRSEAHLYCYVRDKWLVKYRVTAPMAVDGRSAVERFIRTGPWPGRDSTETIAARPSPAAAIL